MLLPDKLVEPTRSARQAPPEKVALQLRGAATAGSNQIKDFKKTYHSDDMRSLWQTVNVADFPQGNDVWTVDYAKLHPKLKTATSTAATAPDNTTNVELVSSTIENFRTAHPELTLEASDKPGQLPVTLSVGPGTFSIDVGQLPGHYEIKTAESTESDPTQIGILNYINKTHAGDGLHSLLSLLASYHSIKTAVCQKCGKLFDAALRLPLARERIDTKDDAEPQWKALHETRI